MRSERVGGSVGGECGCFAGETMRGTLGNRSFGFRGHVFMTALYLQEA